MRRLAHEVQARGEGAVGLFRFGREPPCLRPAVIVREEPLGPRRLSRPIAHLAVTGRSPVSVAVRLLRARLMTRETEHLGPCSSDNYFFSLGTWSLSATIFLCSASITRWIILRVSKTSLRFFQPHRPVSCFVIVRSLNPFRAHIELGPTFGRN